MAIKTRLRPAVSYLLIALALQVVGAAAAAEDLRSITISGELNVIDGDTLEVGPLVIRLHGIDAPELAQTCALSDDGTWPCGKQAVERLIVLLAAGDLSCEGLDRDRYGRVIACCTTGGQDVGARLVEEGLAWAFIEYSGDYGAAEAEAKEAGQGSGRRRHRRPGITVPTVGLGLSPLRRPDVRSRATLMGTSTSTIRHGRPGTGGS